MEDEAYLLVHNFIRMPVMVFFETLSFLYMGFVLKMELAVDHLLYFEVFVRRCFVFLLLLGKGCIILL